MFAVELKNLQFAYAGGENLFNGIDLRIPAGSRTLLLVANGVGKSTLLQLLAGRHLVGEASLRIFGRSPFYDMAIPARIALVDGDFPITVDLRVNELLEHRAGPGFYDPKLQKELMELLEIDPSWRMCRVSEGQRRRVQLLIALRKPADLLLLDEVSSHLDIVVRSDLMAWLRARNKKAGTTIIYTTHILDGLWDNADKDRQWPTHLAFLNLREPIRFDPVEAVPELKKRSLLSVAETLIRNR